MHENLFFALSLVLLLVATASNIYSIYLFSQLRKVKTQFTVDKQPINLEEILLAIKTNIKNHEKKHKITEDSILKIEEQLTKTYQRAGLTRYNAYGDEGGNLSFSLTLLDGTNSGIIITSMHGRDQNRVYTKQVIQGQSQQGLSQEETDSLNHAVN